MNRFSKFAWGVLGWNMLVILWGAFVRASGSGAGCGSHWPTCNGQVIQQPERIETLIEFTHRAMSGLALIFIFTMIVWGFRTCSRGNPVRKGLIASGFFIVLEALLGASLVLFKWVWQDQSVGRAIAVAIHLLNTFFLLGSLAVTAWWASGGRPFSTSGKRALTVLLVIGLAGVAIIGMSGAITALGDTLFPVSSLAEGLAQDANPNASFLVRLRVYHPLVAVVIGIYTLYLISYIYRRVDEKTVRRLSLTLGGLILVQWTAGVTNLVLLVPIWMQLIHLFIADLVWITYILLSSTVLSKPMEAV
jgi:heme A synthase